LERNTIKQNYEIANILLENMCMIKCKKTITKECLKKKCEMKTLIDNLDYHYSMDWYKMISHDVKRVMKLFLKTIKITITIK